MRYQSADIDKLLIEDALNGNERARFELYSKYSKAMFNICIRFLKKTNDAEDILQEVFIEVFNKLHTFRFDSTPGAWIKKITVNKCINTLKQKKDQLEYMDELAQYDQMDEDDAENSEHVKLTVEKVQKAMQLLPEGGRVIFSLYLFEGYDHQEIAEILDISESTSKSQFMRAKNKVKEMVQQFK